MRHGIKSANTLTQKIINYSNLNQRRLVDHLRDFKTQHKTIMVCDDDEDILKLFGQALKSKYNVILVSSGKDCIEKLIELQNLGQKTHLLLLDYRLNGMLGDSVARKIKEYSETKIILTSAYNVNDELLRELEDSNCIAKYIEKPIQLGKLNEIVADIINQIETVSKYS